MFKELGIVAGSDVAKMIAFQYPFNISEAGEVSEARPFTTEQQCAWLKKYMAHCHEEGRVDETPATTTPDKPPLLHYTHRSRPRASARLTRRNSHSRAHFCPPRSVNHQNHLLQMERQEIQRTEIKTEGAWKTCGNAQGTCVARPVQLPKLYAKQYQPNRALHLSGLLRLFQALDVPLHRGSTHLITAFPSQLSPL